MWLVLTLREMGRYLIPPPPHKIVELKTVWIVSFMLVKVTYRIWDPLGPLLHVEKFVVGGGGGV